MGRNFNVPSGEMLTECRAVRLLFINDKALFLALNPALADPFAADWLASIEASEAYPTDEVREDEQQTLTEKVLADMKEARSMYKKTLFYAKLAFPDAKSIWNEFGENDYESIRENQSKYAQFFTNLITKCTQHQMQLQSVGMPLTHIADLGTVRDKFLDDNQDQDAMIKATQEATEERNKQYNETYAYWQQVNAASKIIFEDNPVKLNQYKMPEGPQPDPDINLKGKALDAANNTPLKNVTVKVVELDIVTTTNYAGNYNFVSIPAGTYTLRFVLAGYVTQEIPVTILASGVVVQNVSMAVA